MDPITHTILTTTITANELARHAEQPDSGPTGEEAARLGLCHLLEVDLPNPESEEGLIPTQQHSRRVEYRPGRTSELVIAAQVRELVKTTKHGPEDSNIPPIDALRLFNLGDFDETPGRLLVQALDGVRPRLLELFCRFREYCSLNELASLHTPFPLETLIITNAAELDGTHEDAQFAHVTTLRLHYCVGLRFTRLPSLLKPKRLFLEENDVMDTLCRLAENTRMLEGLEELFLSNSNGSDLGCFKFDRFIASIRKMSHLRVLQLSHHMYSRWMKGYTFNALLDVLPQTIEYLRIWVAAETITDSDPWVEKVRDKTWLPNLREFALAQDMPSDYGGMPMAAGAVLEQVDGLDQTGERTATVDSVSREVIKAMMDYRPEVNILCA
ncbi:hypothetical protein DACRYDRAFT_100623 [Dacryopinax primogenitus]|uniref:F-box domain-containing protein n=1 Tax=Dacryopinax primogenitus (strain DJM 731) TaxID=1858805 RepID=M5FZ20_DACPD|nr:uncharacterized protein DACRYDRAFT_100623 [Dacryopinax primogenitus]EJU01135.1 hypothetical protein DACRYDRAFT_100623 [Dacryopinax primogenitus]